MKRLSRERSATGLGGWLAVALLSGCNLLGLTDVPPQGECSRCEELNLIELPPDCMSWQCGPDNMCVVDLVDQDGDGAPFPRCALDERPADCDDLDGANRPDGVEVCDARSNDCDEAIDEGIEPTVLVLSSTETRGWSWARAPSGALDSRFAAAPTPARRIQLFGEEGLEAFRPEPQPTVNSEVSVAVFAAERAVAYVDDACGAPRIWRYTGDLLVQASDALPRFGACSRDNPMVAPVLALDSERRGLVLSQTALRESCEAPGGDRLFASLISREVGDWGPEGTGGLMLGRHHGLGPAALLAVDGLDFVVAHVEGETLRVAQVEVSASDLSLNRRELHAEPCGAGCGHVSLASAEVDGTREVAVAFRAGPCDAAEVRLRRLAVDGDSVTPIGETLVLAEGTATRIAVAGRSEAPMWAVAWSNDAEVRVERAPSETPISALVVPTVGRVQDAMDLGYGEDISLAVYDPGRESLVALVQSCPPRVDPTEE